jgi:hypothetical protein
MAGAIEELAGRRVGHVGLGSRAGGIGSVKQQVHDGDTITVRALGNFGVRFLGVDAPEISFTLPGEENFTNLDNAKWETFLTSPLGSDIPLSVNLRNHLKTRVGAGTATNHARHAELAQRGLEKLVADDMEEQGLTKETFEFFAVFANEIMDRYGRMLCYLNRRQDNPPRPRSYNERMLELGLVRPYFIWPNLDPFQKQAGLLDMVLPPGTANVAATKPGALKDARDWVKNARAQGLGTFEQQDPLRLDAFEVRYLAQRRAPDRWVIDLGKNDSTLIKPQDYYTIANLEDRLYIPREYVPLFVEAGWQKQP